MASDCSASAGHRCALGRLHHRGYPAAFHHSEHIFRLYPEGRYREAIPPPEGPEGFEGHLAQKAQNRLVLAMAYFRLKDVAKARQVLDRAIAAIPPGGTRPRR